MEKRPVFVLTICYGLGIIVFSGLLNAKTSLLMCVPMFLIGAYFIIYKKKSWLLISIFLLAFILGGFLTNRQYTHRQNLDVSIDEKVSLKGYVVNRTQNSEAQILLFHVNEINNKSIDFNTKLYVYNSRQNFVYGDELYVIAKLSNDKRNMLSSMSKDIIGFSSTTGGALIFLGNRCNAYNLYSIAFKAREYITKTTQQYFSPDEAALAQGIMLGDKSLMSEELSANIQNSGIAHIVAVSGLHVSILLLALTFVFSTVKYKRIFFIIISSLFLISFLLIVGYSPSITRAVLMSFIGLSAGLFWRRGDSLTTLSFSALFILLSNPYALFDVSFQLSFAAVLGIIIFASPISKLPKSIFRTLFLIFITSFSAMLTTGTITAQYFGEFNFTSIWSNAIIVPVVSFALIGGYLVCLLNLFSSAIAFFFSHSVNLLFWFINFISQFAAKYVSANIIVKTPGLIEMIVYFSILFVLYSIFERCRIIWLRNHY